MAFSPQADDDTWRGCKVNGVTGCVGAILLGFLLLVAWPPSGPPRHAARRAVCRSNQKQIATALFAYVNDWDDRLPPAARWEEVLTLAHDRPRVLSCPAYPALRNHGYALNARLAGKRVGGFADPAGLPLLFDSSLNVPNASDAGESFLPAHQGVGNIATLDGRVTSTKRFPASLR